MLKVGDRLPEFSVLNLKSEAITHNNLLGKKVILYFYPIFCAYYVFLLCYVFS